MSLVKFVERVQRQHWCHNLNVYSGINPRCVQNVVIFRDAGLSSSWWYAWHKSSLEKIQAPLSSVETDSRVGTGCLVRLMVVFAARILTHIRILLSCLGAITAGETHSVGVFSGTFSMMSSCSNLYISSSTLWRRWKDIRRRGCATGLTVSSMDNVTCLSFSLPSPRNTAACLSRICWRFSSLVGDYTCGGGTEVLGMVLLFS